MRTGIPCQDAFATLDQSAQGRAAVALADGLGSAPLSGTGSQLAANAALASLAVETTWDAAAIERAFAAAHARLAAEAETKGVPLASLATTLQVATLDGHTARAAMVGDGAVVLCRQDPVALVPDPVALVGTGGPVGTPGAAIGTLGLPMPLLLLEPPVGEYANEVVPLTAPSWREHLRHGGGEGDAVVLFSDGLTRLLLAKDRSGWSPFGPFFDAFMPQVRSPDFDERIVQRFLARPDVDSSWDDDKCLVVVAHGTA